MEAQLNMYIQWFYDHAHTYIEGKLDMLGELCLQKLYF